MNGWMEPWSFKARFGERGLSLGHPCCPSPAPGASYMVRQRFDGHVRFLEGQIEPETEGGILLVSARRREESK